MSKTGRRPGRHERRSLAHAQRRFEADIVKAEDFFDGRLRQPAALADLGLPPDLPDFTIGVLRRTMALDAIGEKQPTIADVTHD